MARHPHQTESKGRAEGASCSGWNVIDWLLCLVVCVLIPHGAGTEVSTPMLELTRSLMNGAREDMGGSYSAQLY
jgi:hypothetical protein